MGDMAGERVREAERAKVEKAKMMVPISSQSLFPSLNQLPSPSTFPSTNLTQSLTPFPFTSTSKSHMRLSRRSQFRSSRRSKSPSSPARVKDTVTVSQEVTDMEESLQDTEDTEDYRLWEDMVEDMVEDLAIMVDFQEDMVVFLQEDMVVLLQEDMVVLVQEGMV